MPLNLTIKEGLENHKLVLNILRMTIYVTSSVTLNY